MDYAPSAQPQRRPARKKARRASSPLPWIIAVAVVIGAGAFWILTRNQQARGTDLNILRDRTEVILASWRDLKSPPSYDKTNDSLFSPTDWMITNVEAAGTRGRVIANVQSSKQGGDPIKVTWEFRFAKYAGDGWTCTKLINTQERYDAEGWKK